MVQSSPLIKPAAAIIAANKADSTTLGIMRFPEDLGAHAMVLNFKKYEYGGGATLSETFDSSITLPLPRNIIDSYHINADQNELGVLGALSADLVNDIINGGTNVRGPQQAAQSVVDTVSARIGTMNAGTLASDALSAARYFQRAGLDAIGITSDLGRAIDTVTGTVVNPHATVVFDGIALKRHEFDWTLSPKNEREAKTLQRIINKIRVASLPAYTSPFGGRTETGTSLDRGLLKYPDMVDIFFVGLDQEYFFYFKTCMVNRVNIDFAPNGIALNKGESGAKPAVINLSISLIESSIHTKDDYIGSTESTVAVPQPFTGVR